MTAATLWLELVKYLIWSMEKSWKERGLGLCLVAWVTQVPDVPHILGRKFLDYERQSRNFGDHAERASCGNWTGTRAKARAAMMDEYLFTREQRPT